jgi:hypothetical protein
MRTHLQLLALTLFGSAACLTGCWSPGTAHAGFSAAKRVIPALENFHHERGHYPESLGELVPEYLPDRRDLLWQGRVQPLNGPRHNHTVAERELGYHREGDAYTLTFSYATFSMNVFTYDSQTRQWYESGYY